MSNRNKRDLPELTEEERKAMEACDLTCVLGDWETRHGVAMNAAVRFMRARDKLQRQLSACRALLREIYAKAVRNKHNIHWHEVTLTDDQMAAILKAAGGGE